MVLKSIFSCHGIPFMLLRNNGPQLDFSKLRIINNYYAMGKPGGITAKLPLLNLPQNSPYISRQLIGAVYI